MIHKVKNNEYCYYCTRCKKASGDGDGLVGEKCLGREIYKLLSSNGSKGGKSTSPKKLKAIAVNLKKAQEARSNKL